MKDNTGRSCFVSTIILVSKDLKSGWLRKGLKRMTVQQYMDTWTNRSTFSVRKQELRSLETLNPQESLLHVFIWSIQQCVHYTFTVYVTPCRLTACGASIRLSRTFSSFLFGCAVGTIGTVGILMNTCEESREWIEWIRLDQPSHHWHFVWNTTLFRWIDTIPIN